MGARRVPGAARAVARDARHARHARGQLRDGRGRPDRRDRRPLRRPHHRQAVGVRAAREVHPHRRRPGRDLQERPGAHPDRRRREERARAPRRPSTARSRPTAAAWRSGGSGSRAGARSTRSATRTPTDTEIKPAARDPGVCTRRPAATRSSRSDVGQHQMWTAQYYDFPEPRRWINSGGLGTMGFGLPAAMGAAVGCPDKHGRLHRRRRLDPDERPGAGDLRRERDPGQGRDRQQRLPRHGPPVAGAVLGQALLAGRHGPATPTSSSSPRPTAPPACG